MPAIYTTRLTRLRIIERLERVTRYPVALIVAPAGFGKSCALRDFLEASRTDALRCEVRPEDRTLLAFVRRLSEALAPVAPGALESYPSVQERVLAAAEPVRELSDWLAEHLKRAVATVVIDDLHFAAADKASIALLADLIERTGERLRWIVAARSDMGLPVATWIAYGRMDLPVAEEDLRFTESEALAAAEAVEAGIDPAEVEALRRLTEGWPVALSIALRTRMHSADLRAASSGARELLYRYLAEQVFAALSAGQRAFTLATCVFSSFDTVIAQEFGATPALFSELRSRVAFFHEPAPGEYRYHDLFRDFLESQLRRTGEERWLEALVRGGEVLERRSDAAGALALYLKAQAWNDVVRTIESSGIAIFERGETAVLTAALDAIPEEIRAGNATLLGLRAMIDAGRGRYELADHSFAKAIEMAGEMGDLRVRLVQRYATELVRRGKDCTALLEPYAAREDIDPSLRAAILGTLATAYVRKERQEEARASIDAALRIAADAPGETIRARVLQQAAYVHRYAGSIEQARWYAEDAVALALRRNLFEVAARAYSILYTIVYDEEDDPIGALALLDKLGECARKGASTQARLFALIGTYEIEVERGNAAAIEALDAAVREGRALFPQAYAQALLPADALRAAWSGDFRNAYTLLANTAGDLNDPERRALRFAEAALYAAAGDLPEQADEARRHAAELLERSTPASRRVLRAQLLLALCELLRGHGAAAHQRIGAAERALPANARRLRDLANAVRAYYRFRMDQCEESAVAAAMERLRAGNFGGIARLLSALPLGAKNEQRYSALTAAEREILQLLVKGASTKEVAETTGRSPHTVDTHIRSICRKLGCSGRREAVALATGAGWVQA